MRAREGDADAADDGDPPDCGTNEHRASPKNCRQGREDPQGCHVGGYLR